MGKRFFAARYPLEKYSRKRAFLRLNESDFEPRHLRPYGLGSGKFSARQMFINKHASRIGRRAQRRAEKKVARQWFSHFWKECEV